MRRIKLITTGVLTAFANIVYANQTRAHRVWLVSPWLQSDARSRDSLSLLIDALRGRSCTVIVFTRPPDFVWHAEAIELIRANTRSILYECRNLHTKLYILECDGFRAAFLGSPNLTSRGDRDNLELAIELRTTVESSADDVAAVITELIEYASALRGEDGVILQ